MFLDRFAMRGIISARFGQADVRAIVGCGPLRAVGREGMGAGNEMRRTKPNAGFSDFA
jgi:hypothetical protein